MTMYCMCVNYLECFVHCKHSITYWSHRILNPRNVYPLIIYEKARLGPKKTYIWLNSINNQWTKPMLIPSNKIAEESCHSKKDEANPLWQFCISYTFEENLSVLITPTITAPREALNPGINDLWLVQLNFFLSPLSQCLPRNGSTWIILHYPPPISKISSILWQYGLSWSHCLRAVWIDRKSVV